MSKIKVHLAALRERFTPKVHPAKLVLRTIAGGLALGVFCTIALYYHGIPYLQWKFETESRHGSGWPAATDKTSASYVSFTGTMDAVANSYGEGCPWIIFVPLEHVDGLKEKLPFSIIQNVEDAIGVGTSAETNSVL